MDEPPIQKYQVQVFGCVFDERMVQESQRGNLFGLEFVLVYIGLEERCHFVVNEAV